MTGVLGERIEEMCRQFNASQRDYAVAPVYRGTYDELINAAVAAIRTRSHPQLVQIYERGFMTMLLSNAIVPVHELMAANGHRVDWSDFIKPIAGFYSHRGQLQAMPFNSSTPILFYSKALFSRAGLEKPATTWPPIVNEECEQYHHPESSRALGGRSPTMTVWLVPSVMSAMRTAWPSGSTPSGFPSEPATPR